MESLIMTDSGEDRPEIDLEFSTPEGKFITISPAIDGEGYMYDIFKSRQAWATAQASIDGGQCTGTLSDAIEMALAQV